MLIRVRVITVVVGRVIEIGAGNGQNFPHYPVTVTEVLAVELDDILRAHAQAAAATAPVPVKAAAGHASALPADDGSFDAAIASLVLCSVPSQQQALAEIARVLRPGGQLRFYEHVRSAAPMLGLLQDIIDPVWSRAGGGCHPNRDTTSAIRATGFIIDDLDRFTFKFSPVLPSSARVIGRAHHL
jgi:ubiquinone/menaquinone biosynthesis C-methylase UbiE